MKQAVRLTLLTIAFAAVAAAAWIVWTADRQITANRVASRQLETTGAQTRTALADLRAAQQSYVAADQGDTFWFARVTATLGELNGRLDNLKSSSTSADAAAALDEASAEIQSFTQIDQRARELTRAKQLTPASDLIYSEGFDQTKKAADAIGRAVAAELAARDSSTAALRRKTAEAAGGTVGLLLFIACALTPVSRTRLETPAITESRPLPPAPVKPAAPRPASAVRQPARLPVDLGGIAALCADFARVANPSALPPLLSRASDILDAAGLVIWVADPDGRELFPTLVHGYPPQIANRLGTLSRDAENVTASAFRTGLLQVVKGTPASNGAVAAPLVGPGGTVGVIAAELRNNGEQLDARRAAVAIVAAQIATLVGPPSARATRTEAAG
jgi:hypothetical protein